MSHTSVSASGHWHGFLPKITAQLFPVPANLEHLNISVTCSPGSKHSLQILVILFEKRCPVPLLLMASIEQLLLVWTCFKSRAGCICECSLVESCLLHTKPKEGEWDVPRFNPCKKQREHVRINISPCKIM